MTSGGLANRLNLPEWKQIPEKVADDQLRRGGTDLLNEMINFLGVEVRRDQLRASFGSVGTPSLRTTALR